MPREAAWPRRPREPAWLATPFGETPAATSTTPPSEDTTEPSAVKLALIGLGKKSVPRSLIGLEGCSISVVRATPIYT